MTGVELIVAALAAGSAAGVSDAASSAVRDAYTGLKGLLGRRLAGRDRASRALDERETAPEVWRDRIGDDLTASGAATDAEVLAAARHLLTLADPAAVQNIAVGTNYGAVGNFAAPITITNTAPFPPASPGAV